MKKCRTCKEIKPLSDFYRNKDCKDGHVSQCKECDERVGNKQRRRLQSKKGINHLWGDNVYDDWKANLPKGVI